MNPNSTPRRRTAASFNQITAHNAGWRTQFRCRGSRHWSGVCEFCRFGERPLVKFKIQGTFTVDGKACVFGRPDRDGDFTVSSSSRLDGVPLLERLEIPPKLRRPELDSVVGFILADPAALSRFHKFDVVELTL